MTNNFIPETIFDRSTRLRNRIALGLIFVTLGGIALAKFVGLPSAVSSNSFFLQRLSHGESSPVGGDITYHLPTLPENQPPTLVGDLPLPSAFTAEGMAVKDGKTGALLYEKNGYAPRPIASITKLMTALVLLEKKDTVPWDAPVLVIGADSLDTHVYAGDTFTGKELWDAALVGSSNKAMMSLVAALDWPEEAVIERMNQKAGELGMTSARFTDTTGLSDGNVASPSDIAILLQEALRHSEIEESLLKKEVTLFSKERNESHHLYTTNWLLLGWIPHAFLEVVGKTGYTPAALYNFVGRITDAEGRKIVVVVLGAEAHEKRFTEAEGAAEAVFKAYRWSGEREDVSTVPTAFFVPTEDLVL